MKIAQVRIVGTGLIGTSIALGLAARGIRIIPIDERPENQKLAEDLLGGQLGNGESDLTIVATPPLATLRTLQEEFTRNPQQRFIDTGSVKTKLLQEVTQLPELVPRFLGTHPMAGRELSGAGAARSDLFQGRAWFLTPSKESDPELIADVRDLVQSLGATPYEIEGAEHDSLLASISHLPQILSSALAGSISKGEHLELAGQGLRDMVRLASSDSHLWSEILLENKENIIETIERFSRSLQEMKSAILRSDEEGIHTFFAKGIEGSTKVSGKHGSLPRNYQKLSIVIDDKPGQLSRLFLQCAEIDANIEDLSIEHSPGQETGLIKLSFSPDDAMRVADHLRSLSWKVHQT